MQEIGRFLKRLLKPESPSDSSLPQPQVEQTTPDLTTDSSLSAVDIIHQQLEARQQRVAALQAAEAARRLAEQQRSQARDEQAIQAVEKELEKQRIRVQEKQRVLHQSGVMAELETIRRELKPDASIRKEEESISLTWTVTFDKEITRTIYHAEQAPFNVPARHDVVGTGKFTEVTEEYGIEVSPYTKGETIYIYSLGVLERSIPATKDLLEISVVGTREHPNPYRATYSLNQSRQKLVEHLAQCYLAADANQRGVYLS